jgi:hypothetical protein
MGEMRNSYKTLVGKPEKTSLENTDLHARIDLILKWVWIR